MSKLFHPYKKDNHGSHLGERFVRQHGCTRWPKQSPIAKGLIL
jgi:hypothetical protein